MTRIPLIALLLLALLQGCATSRNVRTAEGWQTTVISCGGPLLNMGHCLEEAGNVCRGRGYRILNHSGGDLPASPEAIPSGGLPTVPLSRDEWSRYNKRQLYIQCN